MNTRPWLTQYPAYMSAEITPPPFDSLPGMIEDACKKYAALPAAENMESEYEDAAFSPRRAVGGRGGRRPGQRASRSAQPGGRHPRAMPLPLVPAQWLGT